jgi:hypothetical protein
VFLIVNATRALTVKIPSVFEHLLALLFRCEQIDVSVKCRQSVQNIDVVIEWAKCGDKSIARIDSVGSATVVVCAQIEVEPFADFLQKSSESNK